MSMPSFNSNLPNRFNRPQDSSPQADVVNKFHKHSDVDSGALALHHTLGGKANQAAPGDHNHSGIDSPVIEGLAKLEELADEVVIGSREDGSAMSSLLSIFSNIFGLQDSTNTYTGLSFGQISDRLTAFEDEIIVGNTRDGTAVANLLSSLAFIFGLTDGSTSTPLLDGVTISGVTDTEKIDSIIAALVSLGATDGT